LLKAIIVHGIRLIKHRESIRHKVFCLKENTNKLYLEGIGEEVASSTTTRANNSHFIQIHEDLAMPLIQEAKEFYLRDDDLEVSLSHSVLAIDAPTIDFCLSIFTESN
jgi:hypothetical protein